MDTRWSVTSGGNHATMSGRWGPNVCVSRHKKTKSLCFNRVSSEAVLPLTEGTSWAPDRSPPHAGREQLLTEHLLQIGQSSWLWALSGDSNRGVTVTENAVVETQRINTSSV